MTNDYQLHLPEAIVEYSQEVEDKGYLSGVQVSWMGKVFDLIFYNDGRLAQEVADAIASAGYFSEPGLIVVPVVNKVCIETAVQALAERDFVDLGS